MKVEINAFGLGADLITISNSQGVAISFTNFGARIVKWLVPTATGLRNIVWGFERTQDYLTMDTYPGATIGRVAGRIRDGKAKLDSKIIQTLSNENGNTLHGGTASFDSKLWLYEIFEQDRKISLRFSLISNAGENGFPGQLKIAVTHSFDEDGCWTIQYEAHSTEDTLLNPTNHVYFNLTGDMQQSIENHLLLVKASALAILDSQNLPTGEKQELKQSSLNLATGQRLGEIFKSDEPQIQLVNGLDHPFFLQHPSLSERQAELSLENLKVTVLTDRPALVIFTANFSEAALKQYKGKIGFHGGITFEAQVAPGAGEFEGFGSILLKKDEQFSSTTLYQIEY